MRDDFMETTTNIEETITIAEFKSWLAGLIQGKRGALPDMEDWKLIKQMLDKVKENNPEYIPYYPNPFPQYPSWTEPRWNPLEWTNPFDMNKIYCGYETHTYNTNTTTPLNLTGLNKTDMVE